MTIPNKYNIQSFPMTGMTEYLNATPVGILKHLILLLNILLASKLFAANTNSIVSRQIFQQFGATGWNSFFTV
ncbi:MAG: hypothetical protein WBI53_11335 [Paludibacter sp.]